jgi:SAM-dependent methyltransferase
MDWWREFFTGLMADFWREVIPPEVTRAEADFLEKHLALEPGARVADVPCGDGRLALELAARGHAVTGVDLSGRLLAAARENAAARGVRVTWRQSDMRDLPWHGELDAAFCFGNSFGYFDDAGNGDFLRAVGAALRPGGRFALDNGWVAESLFVNFRDRIEMRVGEFAFLAENRYEPRTGRVENVFTVEKGEEREVRPATHRVYTFREIVTLIEAAGLEEVGAFGSPLGEPFALGSRRLLLVARKRLDDEPPAARRA